MFLDMVARWTCPQGIDCFMSAEKPPYLSELLDLACCFLLDDVVKPDDKEMLAKMEQTIEWLNEESKDGNATVKTLLDAGYEAGKTGKEDIQHIAAFLQTHADQGDANAVYLLGMFEEFGVGRERNLATAIELMRIAAEKEHAEAELYLGARLLNGYGVKRSIKESRDFIRRASEHHSAEAREYVNNRRKAELFFEEFRPSLLE